MKIIFKSFLLLSIIAIVSSCEKDEGKLPNISFKTGSSYISKDTAIAGGSIILIGIDASKSENVDVLKKFNISSSVNGATAVTELDSTLTGTSGDVFAYDYVDILDTVVGQTNKYTFTVTNRDGLVNNVSLTVTIQ